MPSYVVTGAARGIGLEFVKQLSADGQNDVFALVRNKTTATHLTALARNNIVVLEADVTDAKALNLAAAEVSKTTGGKLDYLINNAGGSNSLGITITELQVFPNPEAIEEDLLYNFKLNVVSVVHSINAFLPLLKSGTAKKVVSISSGLGDLDFTLQADSTAQPSYSVAKAALNMVVAKFAVELKSEGFVFLALSPGVVNTSSTAVSAPSEKTIEEMKRLGGAIMKVVPEFKGPLKPEESVRMQLEVIHRWTVEDSGAFVSHLGNKQWV
ncbi:hypothetical protein C8F04DRAFT_1251801 [Mycena alexandri]|uniref:NAD(P)-binding protein n=1 Tax=Mycena alexandri TaxID=1745969 RepID=A0AAD6TAS9_9AGAR|nr:hypothetical protein C8F04DRAFT_1251801 [Mycena alexandri]